MDKLRIVHPARFELAEKIFRDWVSARGLEGGIDVNWGLLRCFECADAFLEEAVKRGVVQVL